MSGMKAPAIMQAMPSSCLLMLTVISFPPGLRLIGLTAFETILPQGVPARLWRRGLWRWGDVTEGCWGFSSGLMVLLHLRSKAGGFRCALPDG